MKTCLLLIVALLLTGCTATPQIRVSADGIGVAVVVCPDTGECFVVSADFVPDGWIVLGEAAVSAVNGFETK